ncbi:MAG TPA: response regulator [Chitinophagaceae bacterium]|nr:response regulator [Chitinophagaceae bacterium]
MLVLIVDDNKLFVQRLVHLIREAGIDWEIRLAADYEGAVRIVDDLEPGVILLDINLPGRSGLELLRYVQAGEEPARVVMLTNHADDSYRAECQNLGVAHFLDKSYEFTRVPMVLQGLLDPEAINCPPGR